MSLVGEVLKTVVAGALAIALRDNSASFLHDFAPVLMCFLDKPRAPWSFVVKDDFVSATNSAPKTDADFAEVNLKHMAEPTM